MISALLIGQEPACPLGYRYVAEAPYDAVVIGSLTLGQLMCFQDLFSVCFDTKTRFLRQVDASADDLQRFFCQTFSAFLPDPVCIKSIHLARNRSCALNDLCQ